MERRGRGKSGFLEGVRGLEQNYESGCIGDLQRLIQGFANEKNTYRVAIQNLKGQYEGEIDANLELMEEN